MSNTVIITSNHHSDANAYHTTVCRQVWNIERKDYVDEAEAKRRGYEECTYCSGDYETSNGDNSVYKRAVEIGKRRAGAD